MPFESRPLLMHMPAFLPAQAHDVQGSSRHKFLKAEDDVLRGLVGRFGEQNWNIIASFMKRRSARQCRERYKNYLYPGVNTRPWLPEEEELLTAKVAEFGQKWAKITPFFEGRSDVNVKNHWAAILSRNERVQRFQREKLERERRGEGCTKRVVVPDVNGPELEWPWPNPNIGNGGPANDEEPEAI
jgi:hypothetical protein